MNARRNALKVGIVTVVVAAAFFIILIWISQNTGGEMKPISVRFESSPAMPTLSQGSAVLVGGQRVGRITTARLDSYQVTDEKTGKPVERYFVWVDAEIRSDLILRTDCQAIAEGPPLGGDGILKLSLGVAPNEFTGVYIEGAQPAGFAAILASLQGEFDGNNPDSLLGQIKAQLNPDESKSLLAKLLKSADDVNELTAVLGNEMDAQDKATILAKFHGVVDNINIMTGSLRAETEGGNREALVGKVHLAMDSVNNGLSTVSRLLTSNESSINQSLKNIETTTGNIANETDSARPGSLLAQFKKAGDELTKALEDIHTVTSTTREVVILNRENIDKMLSNFKESSDHLKNGLKYVLRHPWRIFNEPQMKEIKQQAIFDAARSFAEAATRVDDATSQLRALAELYGGKIPTNSPELLRIEADLAQTREKYKKAEDQLWERLKVE